MAGHVEVERSRRYRGTMNEEQHRPWRLTCPGCADLLAEHPQRDVTLLGPVFLAPDLSPPAGDSAWALGAKNASAIPPATRPSPAPLIRVRRANGRSRCFMASSGELVFVSSCFSFSRCENSRLLGVEPSGNST